MLYCEECGCCSELGKGWIANNVPSLPEDDDDEPPCVALYCPRCAARHFTYRPDVGATYVSIWDTPSGQAAEPA